MDELQVPDQLPDMEKMKRMMMVAQMRSTAENNGMGFIGGWMDEKTGEVFYQSNMNEELPVNDFLRGVLPSNAQLPE